MEGKLALHHHVLANKPLPNCALLLNLFFSCLLDGTYRCGEDERPLDELLVLQLGSEHPNGRYNISLCKTFGNKWSQGKRRYLKESGNNSVGILTCKIHLVSEFIPQTLVGS